MVIERKWLPKVTCENSILFKLIHVEPPVMAGLTARKVQQRTGRVDKFIQATVETR